ncbi:MAG: ABC transporter permease, partial [Chitinophagaceae bacterium]|nr:ABC transporter permease [Polaromonas sp.]
MPTPAPRIEEQTSPEGRRLVVSGAWTAADLTEKAVWDALKIQLTGLKPGQAAETGQKDKTSQTGETAVTAVTGQGDPASAVYWDVQPIEKLDHLGAQLLWNHWGRAWPAHLAIAPQQRAVLDNVAKFSAEPSRPPKTDWLAPLAALGQRLLSMLDHLNALLRLVGQLVLDIGRLARHPAEGPWRDLSGHLYHIGATALPITALVGFLIGVVLAYLMSEQLRQFGAD